MRIADKIANHGKFISLEFFPPKEDDKLPAFFEVVRKLRRIDPLFVSVTYGAGGGTRDKTLSLVRKLKQEHELEPMAHLTCVGASREYLHSFIQELQEAEVENILALRGDPPQGEEEFVPDSDEFQHASDLVRFVRANYPEMGMGVAGYPEKHPEAANFEEDCRHLKNKVDLGGDFIITQLFFDNQLYFDFVERMRAMGVDKPIVPGVLPVMSLAGVKRFLSFCGAGIPSEYLSELEAADKEGGNKAVAQLGVEYARKQVQELLDNGAPGAHLYTLNRAASCLAIVDGLKL